MLTPSFTEQSDRNVFPVKAVHLRKKVMFAEVFLEKPLVVVSERQSRLKRKSFHSDFSTDFDTPFINDLCRSNRIK